MGIRFCLVLSYVVAITTVKQTTTQRAILPHRSAVSDTRSTKRFAFHSSFSQRRMSQRHCVLVSGREKRKVWKERSQETCEIKREKNIRWRRWFCARVKNERHCSKLVNLDVTFILSCPVSAAYTFVETNQCLRRFLHNFRIFPQYDRPHRKWNGNVIDINVYLQRLTSVNALTTRSCQNSKLGKHTKLN